MDFITLQVRCEAEKGNERAGWDVLNIADDLARTWIPRRRSVQALVTYFLSFVDIFCKTMFLKILDLFNSDQNTLRMQRV